MKNVKIVISKCYYAYDSGSWNPEEFNFDDALAAFIVMFNYASAQSPGIQRKGLVFLLDFGGWTLQQLRSVKFGRLKTVARLMQVHNMICIIIYRILNGVYL